MGCAVSVRRGRTAVRSRTTVIPVAMMPGGGVNTGVTEIKPLVKPQPYRHPKTITLGDLNNSRNEFWTTRTGGNLYMWQAIRSAAEALIVDDLSLATAILEASNMKTSNGSLELCYDELNRPYKTPLFCFTNPENILDPNCPVRVSSLSMMSKSCSQSTFCVQPLNLRIRINPGDVNLRILLSTADTILDLKHSILEHSSLKNLGFEMPVLLEARQRIVFMGRELINSQLLGDVGVDESKVIQVFVRPLPLLPAS